MTKLNSKLTNYFRERMYDSSAWKDCFDFFTEQFPISVDFEIVKTVPLPERLSHPGFPKKTFPDFKSALTFFLQQTRFSLLYVEAQAGHGKSSASWLALIEAIQSYNTFALIPVRIEFSLKAMQDIENIICANSLSLTSGYLYIVDGLDIPDDDVSDFIMKLLKKAKTEDKIILTARPGVYLGKSGPELRVMGYFKAGLHGIPPSVVQQYVSKSPELKQRFSKIRTQLKNNALLRIPLFFALTIDSILNKYDDDDLPEYPGAAFILNRFLHRLAELKQFKRPLYEESSSLWISLEDICLNEVILHKRSVDRIRTPRDFKNISRPGRALKYAQKIGLVTKQTETFKFIHQLFTDFLAARSLARKLVIAQENQHLESELWRVFRYKACDNVLVFTAAILNADNRECYQKVYTIIAEWMKHTRSGEWGRWKTYVLKGKFYPVTKVKSTVIRGRLGNFCGLKTTLKVIKNGDSFSRRNAVLNLEPFCIKHTRALLAAIEALKDTDEDVCQSAIWVLSHQPPETIFDTLMDAIRNSDTPFFNIKSNCTVFNHMSFRDIKIGKTLSYFVGQSKTGNSHTRFLAISALGSLGRNRAIPTLSDIMNNDKDVKNRIRAVKSIGRIGGDKAKKALIAGFKNPILKNTAAIELSQYDLNRVYSTLEKMIDAKRHAERLNAVMALSCLSDNDRTLPLLIKALRSSSFIARKEAVLGLKNSNSKNMIISLLLEKEDIVEYIHGLNVADICGQRLLHSNDMEIIEGSNWRNKYGVKPRPKIANKTPILALKAITEAKKDDEYIPPSSDIFIEVNFKTHEIFYKTKDDFNKLCNRGIQSWQVFEYLLTHDKIHWTYAYVLWDKWQNKRFPNPHKTFRTNLDKFNKNVLRSSELNAEIIQEGNYWVLSNKSFNCNIFDAQLEYNKTSNLFTENIDNLSPNLQEQLKNSFVEIFKEYPYYVDAHLLFAKFCCATENYDQEGKARRTFRYLERQLNGYLSSDEILKLIPEKRHNSIIFELEEIEEERENIQFWNNKLKDKVPLTEADKELGKILDYVKKIKSENSTQQNIDTSLTKLLKIDSIVEVLEDVRRKLAEKTKRSIEAVDIVSCLNEYIKHFTCRNYYNISIFKFRLQLFLISKMMFDMIKDQLPEPDQSKTYLVGKIMYYRAQYEEKYKRFPVYKIIKSKYDISEDFYNKIVHVEKLMFTIQLSDIDYNEQNKGSWESQKNRGIMKAQDKDCD